MKELRNRGAPRVLWNARDWSGAIRDLPVDGPLPCRTVLVPNERVAHSLRREMLRAGLAGVLAGTRFVGPVTAAKEVLRAAGVAFTDREAELRPTRVAVLVRRGLGLRYFTGDLLSSAPGWHEALAHAVDELERAGMRPEQLPAGKGRERWADVATVWRAADDAAGASWTAPRILAEAAARLRATPALWPYDGPVLIAAGGEASAVQARFCAAVPRATLAVVAARPLRERHVARLAELFGPAAARAARDARAPRVSATERDVLASFLFEPPDVLADAERPRSRGGDGTVDLEEHAGVESELEAAADWAAREILERGTPLEALAILVPSLDPLAGLVVQRLQRLPWKGGPLPLFVAGGLPLAGDAAGARALAVIRALGSNLPAERLAAVLPALRAAGGRERHLPHGAAMDVVRSVGTVGGSATRPEGALEWPAALAARGREIAQRIAAVDEALEAGEHPSAIRDRRSLERLRDDLRAIGEPVAALVGVARAVSDGRPLPEIWTALRTFLERHLLQPGAGPRVPALLDEALAPFLADPQCAALAGGEALAVIEERLAALRRPVGRFGEPAVYVGTVPGATGLCFEAVRVLALAEGHFPASRREDPVLPESERPGAAVPPDRALSQQQALDRVIRDTARRVALSAPRVDLRRTAREPSSLFIDVAAALARPPAARPSTPKAEGRKPAPKGRGGSAAEQAESPLAPPDLASLRRDGFLPARRERERFRRDCPLSEAAWQDRVADLGRDLPPAWFGSPEVDLERIRGLAPAGGWSPMDGILGPGCPVPALPGLIPERPASASRLRRLLECPFRFLLQDVLGLAEPAGAPSQWEIDRLAYGSLFHAVAQAFFEAHGKAFGARTGALEDWLDRGAATADRVFDEFLLQYPLAGSAVRRQQRERLRRDFATWLEYDWDGGRKRAFHGVEIPFGWPAPLVVDAGGIAFHLHGFIDRVDVERGRTLVRDIKTGKPHPRAGKEKDPEPVVDVQLAVYALAAERLAAEWKVPSGIAAAYAYVTERGRPEREYREDFAVLRRAGLGWLEVAARLLRERSFPRTPVADDCGYCPFVPLCEGGAQARAVELLGPADGALGMFRDARLKGAGEGNHR